jgi:alpha-beta hydrolase superfamily lysophospholipase
MVTSACFDGLYHDLFNELDNEPVFDTLRNWLDLRFPITADQPTAAA